MNQDDGTHDASKAPVLGQYLPYSRFTYDLNGRLVGKEQKYLSQQTKKYDYHWDAADQLRKVTDAAVSGTPAVFTAEYGNDARRVGKWDSWTGQHDYTWGGGSLLHEGRGANGETAYTPGLAHRRVTSSGTSDRFYHLDRLGGTRFLSDGSNGSVITDAFRYEGFGQKLVNGGGTTHPSESLFAGSWGVQSEYSTMNGIGSAGEPGLGLIYMHHRYYDPQTGRFISMDPIRHAGGTNLYAYAGNDPVNNVDPSGLFPCPSEDTEAGDDTWELIEEYEQGRDRTIGDGLKYVGYGFQGYIAAASMLPGAGGVDVINSLASGNVAGAVTDLVQSKMHTLSLADSAWRKSTFTQEGIIYVLRDARTGELLKIGQTTSNKFLGRFGKYVTAGRRNKRDLELDVFEVPLAQRGRIEGEIRRNLDINHRLPWDNTKNRLGRPGPGIP